MSTKEAAVSGFAKGAAPYVVGGVVLLAVLGGLQAKYDVTGKAVQAKADVDGAIVDSYTERVLLIDDKKTQELIAEGTFGPIPEDEYDRVYANFGSTDINIMTPDQFEDFAKDPTAYMNAYAAKERWF